MPSSINVNHINPFIDSTTNVLETMVGLSVAPKGAASLKKDLLPLGEVTGIIPLECEDNRGSLAISFSRQAVLGITERLLGESVTEIDDTVIDAVGELTNMVTGGAKAKLAENGFDFDLSRPQVVSGTEEIKHPYIGPTIFLAFDTDVGDFAIEICFENKKH